MTYTYCRQCKKRMRKFRDDNDGGRVFYVCPNCGYRGTFLPDRNFLSDEWPEEVFDEAVRKGVLTKKGRVL